jgi:hypothetical protein
MHTFSRFSKWIRRPVPRSQAAARSKKSVAGLTKTRDAVVSICKQAKSCPLDQMRLTEQEIEKSWCRASPSYQTRWTTEQSELAEKIQKGQFKTGKLGGRNATMTEL